MIRGSFTLEKSVLHYSGFSKILKYLYIEIKLYQATEMDQRRKICSLTREFLRPSIVAIVTINSRKMAHFTGNGNA